MVCMEARKPRSPPGFGSLVLHQDQIGLETGSICLTSALHERTALEAVDAIRAGGDDRFGLRRRPPVPHRGLRERNPSLAASRPAPDAAAADRAEVTIAWRRSLLPTMPSSRHPRRARRLWGLPQQASRLLHPMDLPRRPSPESAPFDSERLAAWRSGNPAKI